MSSFRFKKFSVIQENCAMKVNTDGVLLAAWMSLPSESSPNLLDVGTGSGVMALIAAQRLADKPDGYRSAKIDAVEIDPLSCRDAESNFSAAAETFLPPNFELSLYNIPFQSFEREYSYDLIFSNPPYFTNSLKTGNKARRLARHTDTLPHGELIINACRMLKPGGRFALVLPVEGAGEFMRKIEFFRKLGGEHLELVRSCDVKTTETKAPKRRMLEFELCVEIQKAVETQTIVIQENGEFTAEYRGLTAEFYL